MESNLQTRDSVSSQLFKRASAVIPGGVNSPVRAFRAVGGEPIFVSRADGSRVVDADGRSYVDFVGSWGPCILGHAHPAVVAAVQEAAKNGLTYGAPTEAEVVLAELLCGAFEAMQQVRLVSSGTEATMSAIRLARAHTGRDVIVKLEGCYHGHVDSLLVKSGSGALTLGIPGSPGVTASVVADTLTVPFNDVTIIQELFESRADEIACLIVEPVPGNMGLVLPRDGYLELLRELTEEYDVVLIFDEVISGFRLAYGGAQTVYGVAPDLTCLGKIIGGGMPVGAYGGRRELMEQIAPMGPVYQAGTLSGNPAATAAGIATLRELEREGFYPELERRTARLVDGLRRAAAACAAEVTINSMGSCLTVFFGVKSVFDYTSACAADTSLYARFFHSMLAEGVYLPPSQFETWFVSAAHSDADIDRTIEAAAKSFAKLSA